MKSAVVITQKPPENRKQINSARWAKRGWRLSAHLLQRRSKTKASVNFKGEVLTLLVASNLAFSNIPHD
jgi:hypothetical protein